MRKICEWHGSRGRAPKALSLPGHEPLLTENLATDISDLMATAHSKARESLADAQVLYEAGHYSPAYVWAVRSIEILMKEFLLTPTYVGPDRPWPAALKKAAKHFGDSGWDRGYKELAQSVGPIDQMLTDTDEDAWKHWQRVAVRTRGDVVHGRRSVDEAEARWVVAYARQLMTQLTMRMWASGVHPVSAVLMGALERAREAIQAEREHGSPGTAGAVE